MDGNHQVNTCNFPSTIYVGLLFFVFKTLNKRNTTEFFIKIYYRNLKLLQKMTCSQK